MASDPAHPGPAGGHPLHRATQSDQLLPATEFLKQQQPIQWVEWFIPLEWLVRLQRLNVKWLESLGQQHQQWIKWRFWFFGIVRFK